MMAFFKHILPIFYFCIILTPLYPSAQEAHIPLTIPQSFAPTDFDQDQYNLQTMISQTQHHLKTLENLQEQIAHFERLEQKFSLNPQLQIVANELIELAAQIKSTIEHLEIKPFFSQEFMDKMYFFAKLHSPSLDALDTLKMEPSK